MPDVTKDLYASYQDHLKKAAELETQFTPLAQEILSYRYNGARFRKVTFSAVHFGSTGEHSSDDWYSCKVELLWDPNWRATVDAMIEEERARWQRIAERDRKIHEKAIEDRERKELATLLKKYPDMGQPGLEAPRG